MGEHTHNNHCHCAHEVDYCSICNVCFCKKCGQEWGRYKYWFNTQPYVYPYTTWETNTVSGTIEVSCNHSTT